MTNEAIILAGGLGTRLRSVVGNVPKCMAIVHEKPFLHYLIAHLQNEGINHFIFSLGHLSNQIQQYLENLSLQDYTIVTENHPLGTGGAIKYALHSARTNQPLICNGDTLFMGNLSQLQRFHCNHAAECTLALKPMQHFDRYGVVETDAVGKITSFREKMLYEKGNINAGTYVIDKNKFLARKLPEQFSFEKDFLEKTTSEGLLFGCVQDAYFIDIGVPEDYRRAQTELINII